LGNTVAICLTAFSQAILGFKYWWGFKAIDKEKLQSLPNDAETIGKILTSIAQVKT